MVNKKLLEKELEFYKIQQTPLTPHKYSNKYIDSLFDKFVDYGMVESHFCCMGEKRCCWQDVCEDGVWEMELSDVKQCIIRNVADIKRYLYDNQTRFQVYEDDKVARVYIYGRDLIRRDIALWFSNNSL